MPPCSRRALFSASAALPLAGGPSNAAPAAGRPRQQKLSLNGDWEFRPDGGQWRGVRVPHTWQVEESLAGYMGKAWYRRRFDVPAGWQGGAVRLEFESVFHSARVQLNGRPAGEHLGKGYTAFFFDVTGLVRFGAENTLLVEVDNSFSPSMLPRNNSYDWTPDGGIYRPVWLHVTPALYIERVEIDAVPDLDSGRAALAMRAVVTNTARRGARIGIQAEVREPGSGRIVARSATEARISGLATETVPLPAATIPEARLWHFDHPDLYRAQVTAGAHSIEETFGARLFETRGGGFYLNGERVRLAGVERMAGSHPAFGMAEPEEWIDHDLRDMRALNCVFTRVHWMQDRRVLDWCDRHGMLIQLEVPAWGPATWQGMADGPSPAILSNGLEQLREMIVQNRNHSSVFAWGLCNEVGGHRPAARQFVRALAREARRLDPHRLLTYASNTLHSHPAEDVAGELDFLEWNEYYESWFGGTPEDLRQSLARIRQTWPDKAIVISEYGLCECDPKNPSSDERRIRILEQHNARFRAEPQVAGLIFFCYNDYRTHLGDKGAGLLRQRVHGVVDVLGRPKPSWQALQRESSPVEDLQLDRRGTRWTATVLTRSTVPCYRLTGYFMRFTLYSFGGLPMERRETALPPLEPGARAEAHAEFDTVRPEKIVAEAVRPDGVPVAWAEWRP